MRDSVFDRRAFIAGIMLIPIFASGISYGQSQDPAAVVQAIFRQYQADKVPVIPWSPAVRNAMRKTRIEADPILNAQDIDVKSYSVRQIAHKQGRAEIEARFLSFGRNMVSRFDFRTINGSWVIANYRILSGTEFASDFRNTLKLQPLDVRKTSKARRPVRRDGLDNVR